MWMQKIQAILQVCVDALLGLLKDFLSQWPG